MLLKSRDEIPAMLKSVGLDGLGVEVGAGSGYYSYKLLDGSSLKRLFSIDPWGFGCSDDWAFKNMLDGEWYIKCVQTLANFGMRSVVLRMTSEDACEMFKDFSLDFVYIDASHDYPFVRPDMRRWWNKVRPGGIMAGHDYCDLHWGVKKAVDEFSVEQGLPFDLTELDENYQGNEIRSWLFQKPMTCNTLLS